MNFYTPNPYQQMYTPPMQDQLAQLRQPYQVPQFQQAPQQQQSGMVWVRNRTEADGFPVAPNTAIALWDMSGPFVHRKETDVSGRPVVKTYRLVEVTDAPQQTNPAGVEFVTRQEFQDFVASLTARPGRFEAKEASENE